jgi:orotidine 5'-phosphate decarboxylase subfamily 2
LVEQTAPLVAAFKPNSAFFEALAGGMEALAEVIAAVPAEIPVLLDAKRGDIASTAEAYARAAFDLLGAGALTVNAYPGLDSLAPYLAHEGRAVFVLCRTSNPGGSHFQEMPLASGEPMYVTVARAVAGLPVDRAGLVVGATQPEALTVVRDVAPEHWILAPGVGAQGASRPTRWPPECVLMVAASWSRCRESLPTHPIPRRR